MSKPKDGVTGACRCGRTRFRVCGRPLLAMACHCTGCQKMTASAFSLSALYPLAAFELLDGAPVIGGLHGHDVRHHFCPNCLSWLYSRFSTPDEFVNVRATLLENAADFVPFIETWTSERIAWAQTPAVYSFEGFPPMERYPELLADYARRVG